MTFLFNELLWWYTSGDCVMHSTVRFELWWRATCISPPYKQIWTRWNVTQQFTQLYEQCRAVSSEVGLHMIVAAVSVSPPLITNRPKTLITAKMLIPYYQFTHGVSYSTSLMACPTALHSWRVLQHFTHGVSYSTSLMACPTALHSWRVPQHFPSSLN